MFKKIFSILFIFLFLSSISIAKDKIDETIDKTTDFLKSISKKSLNKSQTIICITNLSSKVQKVHLNKNYHNWNNLIGSKIEIKNKLLILKPFETIWLSNR